MNTLQEVPQDLDIERSLLASILIDAPRVIDDAMDILIPEDFHAKSHQIIFAAIREMYLKRQSIDILTVSNLLKDQGNIDDINGDVYLSEMVETIASSPDIKGYAKILVEKAAMRKLLNVASEMEKRVFQDDATAQDVITWAQRETLEFTTDRQNSTISTAESVVPHTLKEIEHFRQHGSTGIATGFRSLDNTTAGLHPGELVVIAGRPSMGKTALAAAIAIRIVKRNQPVCMFTLETSNRMMLLRSLCSEAKVNMHQIRRGAFGQPEHDRMKSAAMPLGQAPLYLCDDAILSPADVLVRLRRLKKTVPIAAAIIDYLQLMTPIDNRVSREQQVATITRMLKNTAVELNIPIILVSQLNRGVEQGKPTVRSQPKPRLSHLRESGAIEQDADTVILLYREEYYFPKKDEAKNKADIIVAKQRNGPICTVKMAFFKECVRFDDLATGGEQQAELLGEDSPYWTERKG